MIHRQKLVQSKIRPDTFSLGLTLNIYTVAEVACDRSQKLLFFWYILQLASGLTCAFVAATVDAGVSYLSFSTRHQHDVMTEDGTSLFVTYLTEPANWLSTLKFTPF